jgi:ribonuclease HI
VRGSKRFGRERSGSPGPWHGVGGTERLECQGMQPRGSERVVEPWFLITDGASRGNPGEAAIGFCILNADRAILREHGEPIGVATNNQAEYRALIAGLRAAKRITSGMLECKSDSELMVKQMRGECRVKAESLRMLWEEANEWARTFGQVNFVHAPRTDPDIVRVDRLANEALDAQAR